MRMVPKVGLASEQEFAVESRHTIDFTQDGMPQVLSTPALIGFLERTARLALTECLEPGESSVGTEVELRHLAPTPVGRTVRCAARVIHVDGSRVTFQIEARDARETIARGVHRRQVVRADRFARRLGLK